MIFIELLSNDRLVIEKYLIFTSSKRNSDAISNENEVETKRPKVRENWNDESDENDEKNEIVRNTVSSRFS